MWNDITMKNPNFLDPKHPNQPIFQSAFKYVPVQNMNDLDKQMVLFNLLFQYDYFDLFHRCIIDFTRDNKIADAIADNLLATF